jgi:hypothetical protein
MMTEERPRPQYGEYATPEQQHRARGYADFPPPSPAPPPFAAHPQASVGASMTTTASPRRWDLVVTAALLGYGLYTVIAGYFRYSNMAGLMTQIFATQGLDAYAPNALATTLGIFINVANSVLWLLAAWITLRLLRGGKLSFYVPLIAGVLAAVVTAICLMALALSDPSFMTQIESRG